MKRSEWIYATPAQEGYLRRLRNECFAKRISMGYVVDTSRRLLRSEASREIDERKRALEADRMARGAA